MGALVEARDPEGFWYNAKVMRKSGRGASAAVTVHYIGFGKPADEMFTRKAGLRVRLPAKQLRAGRERHAVEKIFGPPSLAAAPTESGRSSAS